MRYHGFVGNEHASLKSTVLVLARCLVRSGSLLGVVISLVLSHTVGAQTGTAVVAKSISGGVTSVPSGREFTYVIQYSYSGSAPGDALVLEDVLDIRLSRIAANVVIGTSPHVASTTYDPGTGRIRWVFQNPLPVGSSGQVTATVRFPVGTTQNGEVANNTATISGNNIAPVTSSNVQISATASCRWGAGVTGPAQDRLNQNVTYRISMLQGNPGEGGISSTAGSLKATLPAGMLPGDLVNVNGGVVAGTGTTGDPVTVTWLVGQQSASMNSGVEQFGRDLVVKFDSARFHAGDTIQVRNDGEFTVQGGATCTGTSTVATLLQAFSPSPAGSIAKRVVPNSVIINHSLLTYFLAGSNDGNTELDNFRLEDSLPVNFSLRTVVTPTLTGNPVGDVVRVIYRRSDTAMTEHTWPGSPFPSTRTSLAVSGLGLPVGVEPTYVRFELGTLLPGQGIDTEAELQGVVVSPGRGGATISSGASICNTGTLMGEYSGSPALNPLPSSSTCVTTRTPIVMGSALKPSLGDISRAPGQTITWTAGVRNLSPSDFPMVNPMGMDWLPVQLDYVTGSFTQLGGPVDNSAGAAAPVLTVIPNYNGSGRTLLRWRYTHSFPVGTTAMVSFQTVVRNNATPGTYSNNSHMSMEPAQQTGNVIYDFSVTDTDDLDGDGVTSEFIDRSRTRFFTVTAPPNVGSVGNLVFLDNNSDGILNENDAGVDGVTVELLKDSLVVAAQTTASGGLYTFLNVTPATGYRVRVIPPAGSDLSSGPTPTGNDRDNGLQAGPRLPIESATFEITPGENRMQVDFGLVKPVHVGNLVFLDQNRDGVRNVDEFGIPGVTLHLLSVVDGITNGTPVASTVSNPSGPGAGYYLFRDRHPGDYVVVISNPPSSATQASVVSVLSDNSMDNDNNGSQAAPGGPSISLRFRLRAGEEVSDLLGGVGNYDHTKDFGFVPPANPGSIGNLVFHDINNDGVRNPGEDGIDGVTVTLLKSGVVLGTRVTASGGLYTFGDVLPGTGFQIRIVPPPGYLAGSTPSPGGNDADNGTQDRPGALISGPSFNLGDGENRVDMDFGLTRVVHVGNLVYLDSAGDGIFNGSDTGIPGVTIQLLRVSGGVTNPVPVATAVSNPSGPGAGYFAFLFQTSGSYVMVISNPPPSATNVSPVVVPADNRVDVDNNGFQTVSGGPVHSPVFELSAGSEPGDLFGETKNYDFTIDFGFVANAVPASMGNLVFADLNNNGTKDGNETGIQGVTVVLVRNDLPIRTNITDINGGYQFGGILPGAGYQVRAWPPVDFPHNSTLTPGGNDADNAIQAAPFGVAMSSLISLSAGEIRNDIDIGLSPSVHVGNRVFLDSNGNGRMDGAETGIPGVTLHLHRVLGGVTNPVPVASRVSNPSGPGEGYYLFTHQPPGTYVITISNPPVSATSATAHAGVDNTVDNDSNGQQALPGGVVVSVSFQLIPGTEPGDLLGGTRNWDFSKDFGFVPNPPPAPAPSAVVLATTDGARRGTPRTTGFPPVPFSAIAFSVREDPSGNFLRAEGFNAGDGPDLRVFLKSDDGWQVIEDDPIVDEYGFREWMDRSGGPGSIYRVIGPIPGGGRGVLGEATAR